ncbi:unnamed protein product, partial [Mesorhabditis spiculigera]
MRVNLKNKLIIISNDIDFDNLPHVLELLVPKSPVRRVQDYSSPMISPSRAQRFRKNSRPSEIEAENQLAETIVADVAGTST